MATINAANVTDSSFESAGTQRIIGSRLLPLTTGIVLISGTAYFVYVGQVQTATTIKFVEWAVVTIGAGAQVAECGLFSTPLAPNKASQSLTKLVATGTIDAQTGTGVKRNTSSLATSVAAGVHLWAGIRTAMATTQPSIGALTLDYSQGQILTTSASGVLTGAGPFTGALITHAVTAQAPNLRVTID